MKQRKERRMENALMGINIRPMNPIEKVSASPSSIFKRRPFLPKPPMGEREKARLERRKFHDVKSALKNPAWRTRVILPA